MNNKKDLYEGLRKSDLKYFLSDVFSVDRFKSKMGSDENIIVLSFRVHDKMPGMDLEEFIESGYDFILDADVSPGEEQDGKYSVFVEIERNKKAPKNVEILVNGIGKLADIDNWRFRYYKDASSQEFSIESFENVVPLTPEDYEEKVERTKEKDLQQFFDKGSTDLMLENNILTFKKPYSGNLQFKLVALGDYNHVKLHLPGKLNLSEAAQSQLLFLDKYLGDYEIEMIHDLFLIKNQDQAVILEKYNW